MKKNPYSLCELIAVLVACLVACVCFYFFWDNIIALMVIAAGVACVLFYTIETLENKRKVVEFQHLHGLASIEIAKHDIEEIKEMSIWQDIPEDEAEWRFFAKHNHKD